MSKVIRLTKQAVEYLENFKNIQRGYDVLYDRPIHIIDDMADSQIIEYMLSYALKDAREAYEKHCAIFDKH